MKNVIRLTPSLALLLVGSMTLYGCSGSQEDVRVSYCKNLTTTLIEPTKPLQWTNTEQEIHRPEYAVIKLSFTQGSTDAAASFVQSACWYEHDAPEENASTLADPLSAYATMPYQMTLNGNSLSEMQLHKISSRLLINQGKELADKIEQGFKETVRKVSDKLDNASNSH